MGSLVSTLECSLIKLRFLTRRDTSYSIFSLSFDTTLLIVGVFATAAGASPNYIALCSFAAVWSIGVGGNLPVDSSIFLGNPPAT